MKPARIAPAADDLLATAAALWPAPARVELVRSRATGPRDLLFLPSAARPRLLVPAGTPRAAAAAVRRYSDALSRTERTGRALLAAVLRTGVADHLATDRLRISGAGESVETVLADLLGEPVTVSLGLGNRRANQKPVLQAFARDGRTLAFVKVGDSPVATELVAAEAAALERVADLPLPGITVPRVLGRTTWRGLDLLVLSPLATSALRRRPAGAPPYAAFGELSMADGVRRQLLGESPFWERLAAVPARLDDPETRQRYAAALAAVAARHGDEVLGFGCWHGDWTPWNMHRDTTVALWDWERFARGVPLGFDALHYRLRVELARAPARAGTRLRSAAPGVLARVGVEAAGATLAAYLLELSARFALAAQQETGGPIRPRTAWLLDFLGEVA